MRKKRDPSRERERAPVWGPLDEWGFSSPEKIEDHLIRASEGIVAADRVMEDALPRLRRTAPGDRSRIKENIGYLQRLLQKAIDAVEKANREIGF